MLRWIRNFFSSNSKASLSPDELGSKKDGLDSVVPDDPVSGEIKNPPTSSSASTSLIGKALDPRAPGVTWSGTITREPAKHMRETSEDEKEVNAADASKVVTFSQRSPSEVSPLYDKHGLPIDDDAPKLPLLKELVLGNSAPKTQPVVKHKSSEVQSSQSEAQSPPMPPKEEPSSSTPQSESKSVYDKDFGLDDDLTDSPNFKTPEVLTFSRSGQTERVVKYEPSKVQSSPDEPQSPSKLKPR